MISFSSWRQFGFERASAVRELGARGAQRIQRFLDRRLDDVDAHHVVLDLREHARSAISIDATSRFAHTALPRSR